MKRKLALLLGCVCFFLNSPLAAAATRTYQIDMIVFKNTATPSAHTTIITEPSLPSESQLRNALTHLKANPSYEVLLSQRFMSDFKTGVKQTFQIDNSLCPLVSGSISFVLGYYFDIDLHLDIPPTHVDKTLQVNSRKWVYIDAPHYGVLLYLSPVETKGETKHVA